MGPLAWKMWDFFENFRWQVFARRPGGSGELEPRGYSCTDHWQQKPTGNLLVESLWYRVATASQLALHLTGRSQ